MFQLIDWSEKLLWDLKDSMAWNFGATVKLLSVKIDFCFYFFVKPKMAFIYFNCKSFTFSMSMWMHGDCIKWIQTFFHLSKRIRFHWSSFINYLNVEWGRALTPYSFHWAFREFSPTLFSNKLNLIITFSECTAYTAHYIYLKSFEIEQSIM